MVAGVDDITIVTGQYNKKLIQSYFNTNKKLEQHLSKIGKEENFAVLLGDDIIQSETPCLTQLINMFIEKQANIIGVLDILRNTPPRKGGEIQLTDAIRELSKTQKLFAYILRDIDTT